MKANLFKPSPIAAILLSVLVGSCAVGPDYKRPELAVPEHYIVQDGWVPAAPADAQHRGEWWQLFQDPTLNELENSIDISNQNVLAAKAAYDQARALIKQERAAMFPSVDLSGGATRSDNNANRTPANQYQLAIGGSWEPDLWGSLGRATSSARASAQASEADLLSAKLSAQGELAANYLSLRHTDVQLDLLTRTVETYQRAQQITQNRFALGAAAKTDVLQAQSQLASAQANLLGLQGQREQLAHAIAVLVGKTPEAFNLDVIPNWQATVPQVPLGLPSELLQRRPDIAGAERRVAAANEEIGIAKAGYFPSLRLTGSYGNSSSNASDLTKSSLSVWTLGAALTQTLFDAGATGARVSSAKAAHERAVANYRQTVLTAFQDVEDQLTAIRILSQQQALYQQASEAADQVEQQTLNRYRLGQISFTDVVSAQTSALNARRSLAQARSDSQTASVALIQALGGDWQEQAKP